MATTHALVGAALGASVATVSPELAPVAALAGFAGGLAPDLDLYAGHRKTLHFPVYFSLLAVPAVAAALLWTGPATVALALFLVAAALHSVSDVIGGGLELRPWEGTSDRGVYSHYHGTWIAPRQWIRYDGAPEDFALGTVVALVPLLLVDGPIDALIAAALVVSFGYTLVRRRLPDLGERIVAALPDPVLEYVPARFLDIEELSAG